MIEPNLTPDEPFRLSALRNLRQLDTPTEERFERITRLAQRLLGTPIAAISLVDAGRQWFKSIQGLNVAETTRDVAFCAHTILQDDVMVVPDARLDPRFARNPLVTNDPNIVFYAGCPIRSADGCKIASLCVIDRVPRSMSIEDQQLLRDLAAIAASELGRSADPDIDPDLLFDVPDHTRDTQRDSQVEPITRTWSRQAIFDLLSTECTRAARWGGGVGVILLEADQYQELTQTRGRAAAEELLRLCGKRTLGAIRTEDELGYCGDGTFMVIVGPCDGARGATELALRIREQLSARPCTTEGREITLTASLGVSYHAAAFAASVSDLVRNADDALHKAKLSGRNRVESAADPVLIAAHAKVA